MDRIFIRQLEISAIIGIWEYEKETPQTIYIDLEAAVDVSKAAATDHIASTVDYFLLYTRICEYIPTTRFELLETLATHLSDLLIQEFALSWLRLTITKKPTAMPNIAGAGIIIERGIERGQA